MAHRLLCVFSHLPALQVPHLPLVTNCWSPRSPLTLTVFRPVCHHTEAADTQVLVSLDVVSLFTRVPTTHAIQVTRERLLNDLSLLDRTSLTVEDICSLLKLCLEATYLSFRGKIYQQVHRTAMVSPVSVVVANLVMEGIEQNALSTFHIPPCFWRWHADDTYTVLPGDLVHNHINSIQQEHVVYGGGLRWATPFLDMLLTREEGKYI